MAMFCPHCGAQTDEADKFCVICGELVHATAVCGVCGESIPISAAFCPTCGTNFLEHPELSLQDPQRLSTHGVVAEPVATPVEEDAGEEGEEVRGPAPMPGEAEEEPEEDIKDDTPLPDRSRLRLPRALQWALGMQEEDGEGDGDSDELPPEEGGDEAEQAPDPPEEEDNDLDVGDEACGPRTKKRGFRFSWRKKQKATEGSTEELEDNVADEADMEDDLPDKKKAKKQKVSLFQKLKREREADEEHIGLFARLMARFKKPDGAGETEVAPAYDDPDDEGQEAPKTKRISPLGRRKKAKKANLADEEAQKEFAEKANYDGYYDDVRPADYGETDEERGQLDVKAIVLLVAGLTIFCVIVIKLQSLL